MEHANYDHCKLGLFHDSDPLHKHGHCNQCFRMRRCEGHDSTMKLQCCSRCSTTHYCSKDCQKKHWRAGHKAACTGYKLFRDRAAQLSGNPHAWSELMQWAGFHHTSIINATLACYIHNKDEVPDITSKYLLQLSLDYRGGGDPESLPVKKKFALRGAHFVSKDDPQAAALYSVVFAARPRAVEMGKMEMGSSNRLWGTGAYFLMVRFRPPTLSHRDRLVEAAGTDSDSDGVPFWRHFGIDRHHAAARLACRSPLDQLEENLVEGRKMKFCCGKVEGLPTCCCGGWTHELVVAGEIAMI
ncbi:hypothetical protein LXA43DRAFT_1111239 [Ganoderma leucocontextum]|nr:hypothetical protein LXA43DRAFT_1111239 [Ganoderma leucocontextum]